MSKNRRAVATTQAPQAIGPYSQAVRVGELMFVSGQIPLDPATGNMVPGGIAEQTEQVMKNLRGILESQGVGFEHVVKTTVYLIDMSHFAQFNEVYGRHLQAPYPARATIQVGRLPKDALVEIEAVVHTA